ncbi:hypothetical protein EGR_09624 [Echinococcus granulosus]|uniref:Uncharacterized protein n=1 Tax=Echinococcus granulosus TaxID=6210 RepID=W6U348_ECHGR|nr:hypothetical protein EGR_09624 [Echinococcus granulosus]EUB55518.1 hypothetical protein EGR_09624 [Echinococcus granulosus]
MKKSCFDHVSMTINPPSVLSPDNAIPDMDIPVIPLEIRQLNPIIITLKKYSLSLFFFNQTLQWSPTGHLKLTLQKPPINLRLMFSRTFTLNLLLQLFYDSKGLVICKLNEGNLSNKKVVGVFFVLAMIGLPPFRLRFCVYRILLKSNRVL